MECPKAKMWMYVLKMKTNFFHFFPLFFTLYYLNYNSFAGLIGLLVVFYMSVFFHAGFVCFLLLRLTCLRIELVIAFNSELYWATSLILSLQFRDATHLRFQIQLSSTTRGGWKNKFNFKDRVFLKCKRGYSKLSGGVLSCEDTNQWTGNVTCSRNLS